MLAVILAGGQSRRMGSDKAMLPCGGKPMAQHLIDRFRESGFDVAVSVDAAGRFALSDALELSDAFPGQGPLNGLHAAFTRTEAPCVFLTGTDLPDGDPALAMHLVSLLQGADACLIRRMDGTVETMFGVYTRRCLPAVERCLRTGRRAMLAPLDDLQVRYVEETELSEWDLRRILRNVNTPEEYAAFCRDGLRK